VVIGVIISLFVSLTLTPMLCARYLRIVNMRVKYKKTAAHQLAILLGYSGLIQQRIE